MTSSRQPRAIVIMTRAPSAPGKTRLTIHLSNQEAQALRKALLLDTVDAVRSLAIPLVVQYAPRAAREEIIALIDNIQVSPQRGNDLGMRMFHAAIECFAAGAQAVAIVGSDVPTVPPSHLMDAFVALESGADVVFGPTHDGGYYLIALNWGSVDSVTRARQLRDVFEGIAWGSDRVLQQSQAAAKAAGLKAALIAPWFDVDVPEDLARVVSDPRADAASRTRACVSAIPALQPPGR